MKPRPIALLVSFAVACDGAAPPPGPGVDVPEGPCGHALFVVATDYQSSSVSVVGWGGEVLSAGMIHSGTEQAGLSVALSGDVVAPTDRVGAGQLLVLDRYPASVATLIDPVEAAVTEQVNVQTGFASNPQDAVFARPDALYVSRYERNPAPGKVAFDAGSDLLVVTLPDAAITGRVDLGPAMVGAPAEILPRPGRMVARGGLVYALLSAYSADFKTTGDARVAIVDPEADTVVGHAVLAGARGCSGLAASPSGARLAVACSGTFGGTGTPDLSGAGVVVLDRGVDGSLVESRRFDAAVFDGEPLSFTLDFVAEDALLVSTFGALDDTGAALRDDRLLEIDLTDGSVRELLRSAGEPFTLGDIRCGAACGACFVADAGRGGVQRFSVEGGRVGAATFHAVDDGTGLPPRYLGAY